jgi:alkylation response protein AidB-like acyl-CoA dehydrogenase
MDLSLNELQDQSVNAFRRLLERECTPARVRAAEPLGFDAALWCDIVDLGLPAMGVPQESGGLGLPLLDMALIAEVHGEFLAPAPLIETMVGLRLLARCGTVPEAVLGTALDKGSPLAILLRPADGDASQLVPAGAVAPLLIGLDGDELVVAKSPAPGVAARNIGASPLAFRSLREGSAKRIVLARGAAARQLHRTAVSEWKVLTAAALAGLSAAALRLGVEYARTRQAFGSPIGAYQGVSHRLGDASAATEGSQLIARAAADAADTDAARFPTLASMAFAFCAETAHATAAHSLHVHGGYGFTLEYDIQLYLRRAKTWPLALHDPRREYQHIAHDLFDTQGALQQWIFD